MRAGTLRERITFQKQTPSGGDADWAPSQAWVDEARVWASVSPKTGDEKNTKGDGVQTLNSFTITTRYVAGITSQHRILWRGRTLDIVSVVDTDSRRREQVIEAKESPQRG